MRHRWIAMSLLAGLLGSARPVLAGPPSSSEERTGPSAVGEGRRARLVVVIQGLRNRDGVLRLALFGEERGFPSDHARAVQGRTEQIDGSEVRVVFEDLEPGTYALSVFHDEDGNGRLRRGIFGIPTEGIAFSRDARNPVGPPKWKDAKFDLPPGQTTISCTMRY